jgi:hypothetical protein
MYIALLLGLLFLGGFLLTLGIRKRNMSRAFLGALVGVFAILFFWFLGFWGDFLWFDALGYEERFWTVVFTKMGTFFAGAVFGLLALYFLTWSMPVQRKFVRAVPIGIGTFIAAMWGLAQWDTILIYLNRVSTDVSDPILHKNTGFYLFTLPLLDSIYSLFFLLALTALVASFISLFARVEEGQVQFEPPRIPEDGSRTPYRALYLPAGILLLVLAWGKFLDRYHILYSTAGVVTGAGWTDVHIRLPAYYIVAVLTGLLGVILLIPALRERMTAFVRKLNITGSRIHMVFLGAVGVVTFGLWIVLLSIMPGLFQWLRVEPNELTLEQPYIANNIEFTRYGFGLHRVEEREYPATGRFTPEMIPANQNLFDNIRLWDWRALDAVYKQFQEIRLYYEFEDVDIDRYTIDNAYRQVMVSARELELSNLPEQSQTFVNQRFKYTHGYGITLTTVSEFTPEGLPNLLIKDIPPQSAYASLKVEQPAIYYGELTDYPVVANSEEEELDYPSGEENVYTHYAGNGGVQLRNLWRKFLFGWKFDGTRFFLSGYPRPESRIMFRRLIRDRVKTLAPFLRFDEDPYIVLAEGKLYWIIDAYTTSEYYPYSEPFSSGQTVRPQQGIRQRLLRTQQSRALHGINYIRNSVKVVIDAYNGSVDMYMFEPRDPMIQMWNKVFPGLFQKKEDMPENLVRHVRYPADMLLVQGLIYAKYHMTDPTVFYNQEDLWIRATEKYRGQVQPVDPYYIMWELPGSDEPQFVIIQPFTPKNRQVLIGWIAGMCDGDNYGRFLAYKFPKEKRVLGTQQVETKIDQDSYLSGQLTLWDQRGSNVIRGNVLAIPIEKTLLYVEPIYLQAETAAYPELRLVVVMHQDNLSYAETFDQALRGLFKDGKPEIKEKAEKRKAPEGVSLESLITEANEAFENYLRYLGDKQFTRASQALDSLQKTLEQLSQLSRQ